jgi:hypothetical protein
VRLSRSGARVTAPVTRFLPTAGSPEMGAGSFFEFIRLSHKLFERNLSLIGIKRLQK